MFIDYMKRLVLVFIFLLIPAVATAHQPAKGNIYVTLGPSILIADAEADYWGLENDPSYGLSLIVNGDVDRNGGLEVGMAYFNQLFFRDHEDQKTVGKAQRLHMNLGYRHWFVSSVSAGLLLVTHYSMGGVDEVASSDFSLLETSGSEASDSGLSLSFQYEFSNKKDYAIIVDYRFTEMFHLPDGEESRSHMVTLGLKKHVQKK